MNDRQGRNDTRARNPKGQGEGAAQSFESVANEFVENAARAKDEATRAGDQAIHAGTEMFERSAETVQDAFQSSAKEATERTLHSIEAVVQSSAILTEMMQRMYEEGQDIARARIERGFDCMRAMMQARTPQEIIALQSEMLRDNIETFLGFARKAGEHSTRFAEEAKRQFGTLAEGRKSA
jgi:phasin family protein